MKRSIGYYVDSKGVAKIGKAVPLEEAKELARQKLRQLSPVNPESGCWEWQKTLSSFGYGQMYWRGKQYRTHRLSYYLFKGELNGLDVCHSCDNKKCNNPDHLWLGTHRENMLDHIGKGRHFQKEQTVCKRGHPLSGDNVEVRKLGPNRGYGRKCKECQRYRMRRAYQRKHPQALRKRMSL